MSHIRQSVTFRKWLLRLEDRTAKARLVRRIERLAGGYAGDHRFPKASQARDILRARQMIEQLDSRP
jgi:hypothetical protein